MKKNDAKKTNGALYFASPLSLKIVFTSFKVRWIPLHKTALKIILGEMAYKSFLKPRRRTQLCSAAPHQSISACSIFSIFSLFFQQLNWDQFLSEFLLSSKQEFLGFKIPFQYHYHNKIPGKIRMSRSAYKQYHKQCSVIIDINIIEIFKGASRIRNRKF